MAFRAFDNSTVQTEFVPWANEYVEKNPKQVGKCWDVRSIKLTDKGMILETEDWAGWYFKSDKNYKFLLEFVGQWFLSKKPSPILQLALQKSKPYFLAGVDDERQGYWGKSNKEQFTQSYATVSDNPEVELNPLPLPPSPNSVPTEERTSAVSELDGITQELSPYMALGEPARSVKPSKRTKARPSI